MSTAWIETPGYEERVFLVGANGSGKSIAAGLLIEPYPRCWILDTKGDFSIPWEDGKYQIRTRPPYAGFLDRLRWRFGNQRIVYRPEPMRYDSGPEISRWYDWAYRTIQRENAKKKEPDKRGRVLYVDEGLWASYVGAWQSLARLIVSTRSLKLGVWVSSQRPKGIPVSTRSEAWRWIVFYLRSREDRKEVVSYLDHRISEYDLESTEQDYQFLEIRRGKGGRMAYRWLPPLMVKTPGG